MSFKSITFALALTASFSAAEKMRLAELMNLQNEVVKELDLGHTEPEVDHRGDSKHREHIKHANEAEWEAFVGGADDHCPVGYQKIGCCKCVHDEHVADAHIGGIDHTLEHEYGLDAGHHDEPRYDLLTEHTNSESDFHGQMYGYHQPGYRHDEGVWKMHGHFSEHEHEHEARDVDHDYHYGPEHRQIYGEDKQSSQDKQQKEQKQPAQTDKDSKSTKKEEVEKAKKEKGFWRRATEATFGEEEVSKTEKEVQKQVDLQDQRQKDLQAQLDQKQGELQGQKDQRQDEKETQRPSYDKPQGQASRGSQSEKPKLTMHTSEEQARSRQEPKQTEKDQKSQKTDSKTATTDEKAVSYEKKQTEEQQCPKGFTYETKERKDAAPWKIEACRMPMSYELGAGFEHHCTDCHYSYGRWLDRCTENFTRNGCCTCTPHCPEGMVMDMWLQDNVEVNNYVCLIRSLH